MQEFHLHAFRVPHVDLVALRTYRDRHRVVVVPIDIAIAIAGMPPVIAPVFTTTLALVKTAAAALTAAPSTYQRGCLEDEDEESDDLMPASEYTSLDPWEKDECLQE